jgi:ATP-dependent RNA helicase DDX41
MVVQVFCLPMVMLTLEQEKRMPFIGSEGPYCLALAPSRELARQTYEIVSGFTSILHRKGYYSIFLLSFIKFFIK